MWSIKNAVVLLLFVFETCSAGPRAGFGPGMQDWGFVEVRKGAHMFWWLYYTTADVEQFTDRPLLIWLQGGPGASSMYGNFEELGPINVAGEERKHTWVKDYNVIFIDNPVGTGFSYVDDNSLLTKDNAQIADDLLTFTKEFYKLNPEFKNTPLHIYGLSYAGKMAPEFAFVLDKAIKNGEIDIKLESVGIIGPWVFPIVSILSWAEFLLNMGFVDTNGYREIQAAAISTEHTLNEGKFSDATWEFDHTVEVMLQQTLGIDLFNVMLAQDYESIQSRLAMFAKQNVTLDSAVRLASEDPDQKLIDLMRGPVASALQLPAESVFKAQDMDVFGSLDGDFMKPAMHIVELLLNNTSLDVIVVTGQLDLIVPTPGTVVWLEKLQWDGRSKFMQAPRNGVGPQGQLEGYQKSFGRLYMYWALRAGHMVPADNPVLMDYVLQKQTGFP